MIRKKLNFHREFLSADQDMTKKCWPMGWIGCPIVLVSSKRHHDFLISFIFLQSYHQVGIKNIIVQQGLS